MTLASLIDEQNLLTVVERQSVLHEATASRSRGAGRKRAATKPASGVSALIVSAAGSP